MNPAVGAMLRADKVSVIRGGFRILDRCSLEVGRGEIHALIGLNGSGKSTLALTIMGCYKPTSGRIFFEGEDITDLGITERARRGITLAWQEPARIEGLTVRDYLRLSMKLSGGTEEDLEEALERVALNPRRYLDRELTVLSGGERKRVELASVFLMRPKLAILDEPDSGIDMLSLDDIFNLIRELKRRGATVLVITHNERTLEVADAASLMCNGRVIKQGDPAEIASFFRDHCRRCGGG